MSWSIDIINYDELTRREKGIHLQHGMDFEIGETDSVILMSQITNAPYQDELKDN